MARAFDPGWNRAQRLRRVAFWSVLAAGAVAAIAALLVFAWPDGAGAPPSRFVIAADEVPAAGDPPLLVAEGRFWLVNLAPGEGVVEMRTLRNEPARQVGTAGPGGLLALSVKDPHKAAGAFPSVPARNGDIPWRAEFVFEGSTGWFLDGCGGSTYTKAGVRVFGPSPRSMDTYAVTVRDDGSVTVDTDVVMLGAAALGADDNPLRAVAYPTVR